MIFQVREVKAHFGSRGRVAPSPPPRYDFMFNHRYSLDSLIEVRNVNASVCEANLFVSVSPIKSADTSLAAVTRLRTGLPMNWGSFPGSDKRLFSSTELQDQLWGHPSPLFSG